MSTPSQAVPVVFSFDSHKVRTIMRDNEPWFIAADVCTALSINNPSDALRRLDEDEQTLVSTEGQPGRGAQSINIINESGLYSLILGSRKPEAQRFKKWITSEVLPALRKTGSYTLPGMAAPATNTYPPDTLVFNGVPVFTNTSLASCFGVDRNILRGNHTMHPSMFKLGVHYFKLSGHALRQFKLTNAATGEISRRTGRELVIWSLDGARLHATMFPRDIARRGLQQIEASLRGEAITPAPTSQVTEQATPTLAAAVASATQLPATSMRVLLNFPNATALGNAMPDLLALTRRHGIELSITGATA